MEKKRRVEFTLETERTIVVTGRDAGQKLAANLCPLCGAALPPANRNALPTAAEAVPVLPRWNAPAPEPSTGPDPTVVAKEKRK